MNPQPIHLTIHVTYPKRFKDKEVDVLKFYFPDRYEDLNLEDLKEKINATVNEKIDWKDFKVQALQYGRKYIREVWDIQMIPKYDATLVAFVEQEGKSLGGGKRNKKSNRQRNSKKNRKSRRRRV